MPILSDNTIKTTPDRRQTATRKCAHCANGCAHGYDICYHCVSSLPIALRRHMTREYAPNGPAWRKQRYTSALWDVRKYLAAPDREAHLWEKARAGNQWAMDALKERGLIDDDGIQELIMNLGLARLQQ